MTGTITLTDADRADILRRYINRDTFDSPWSPMARAMTGKSPAHETDAEWIANRAWRRAEDGRAVLASPD